MAVPRKIGSVSAIVGALVLMTGTMFHPLGADPWDHLAAFTEYAADDGWVASHLIQFVGVALMFIGLVAVHDTLREGSVAGIAHIGVLMGTATRPMNISRHSATTLRMSAFGGRADLIQ